MSEQRIQTLAFTKLEFDAEGRPFFLRTTKTQKFDPLFYKWIED